MPTSTTGRNFTAKIGTVAISGLLKGDVGEEGDELDATDSLSAPFTDTDMGCYGVKGTLEGHHRVDLSPFPTLAIGTVLTNLNIFMHGGTVASWIFPSAIVTKGSASAEIRGKVQFTINFSSKGTYTRPA